MQTRAKQVLRVVLILLLLFPFVQSMPQSSKGVVSRNIDSSVNQILDDITAPYHREKFDAQTISESTTTPSPMSGTFDPIPVEQSGYYSTGNISARTDTSSGTEQAFPIDTDHNWMASTAEIDVWDLERMYVVNGTFDAGIPGYTVNPNGTLEGYPFGWIATSNNTDPDQTQLVSYVDSGRSYVSVQNQAEVTNNPQHIYTHYAGTYVFWNQTIDISPYTTDFILSFDYLYLQGLLNPSFSGDFSLQVLIDNVLVYSVDLPSLAERGTWYTSGQVPITVSVSPGPVDFVIGLVIQNTMVVDGDNDYDLDSFPDGAINTQFLTVYIDDVSLVAQTPPNCDEVSLNFSVNGNSSPILGTAGTGFAQIVNQSYWTTSSLSFSVSSNTSISLQYNARLLNHRFINSSSTPDAISQGVSYTIESGINGKLELYSYLGFLGLYENFSLRIYHAVDWENITIYDPFLTNVTSSCVLEALSVTIPEDVLDLTGWWKVACDVPNYGRSSEVERYDTGTTDWIQEDLYHSSDSARTSVSLGTLTEIPLLNDPIDFRWILPNGSIWYQDSTVGGAYGNTSSSSITFGSSNTTAGIWCVSYFWSNGSELAYDCVAFTLHHSAVLEAVYSTVLETVVGQPVSVFLRFRDAENGLYILNDGASVVGNWSGSDVEFTPDIVKNWWQADFDTALVGAGEFAVRVVSAAPFFETVPLWITIRSQFLTTLSSPTGPLTPLIYGRDYSFDYFYAISYNGSGIIGAAVEITEEGSEWATVTDEGNGHYNISLQPMASGDYSIRIAFSKIGYQNQSHVLSFLVDDVSVDVDSISSLESPESLPLHIEVHLVESDTRNPVTNANVSLTIYFSGGGLYTEKSMNETSPGVYSTMITMPSSDSGTCTVWISIEKPHYVLTTPFSATLVPQFDPNARIIQTLVNNSMPIVIIAVGGIVAFAGQRTRKRRRRIKHQEALQIKHRFNDANNILGFLVLHKLSGLPVYSKVFKGGFEESMLSAFITAIMHFREEFASGSKSETYTMIPISEVVRTVPTVNLICAFITITPPSAEQEQRMINYARAIGMMFDESFTTHGAETIDAKIRKSFEWLFDDLMDGILAKRYQLSDKKFPKDLRFIQNAIQIEESNGSFNLSRLMILLTSTDLSEDDVYIRLMRAIDEEYILPVYQISKSPDPMEQA
ncbi:MAG: hypothetical protein ACFFCP_00210 [Promethearchaeota archaeon]